MAIGIVGDAGVRAVFIDLPTVSGSNVVVCDTGFAIERHDGKDNDYKQDEQVFAIRTNSLLESHLEAVLDMKETKSFSLFHSWPLWIPFVLLDPDHQEYRS